MVRINSKIRIWSKIQVPKSLVPFVHWIQKFFIELCNNSNIHGLRYFTGRFLHWTERLWWIIAVGTSLWLCSSMIQKIWIQWNEKPVTMHFHEKEVSITTIPFPTVTICPETKFSKHKFDLSLALKSLSNLSNEEAEKFNALSHICPLLSNSLTFKENFTSENIYNTIQNVALDHGETIMFGKWNNVDYSKNIVPILTDEGLCFTFNALNSHEMYTDEMAPGMMIVTNNPNITHWSLEHGYEKEFVKGEYLFRMINSYLGSGLIIWPTLYKEDFENQCKENGQSFKITLTEPGDVPKMSQSFRRISLAENVVFWLNPKVITTSDGLRNYKPSQRQCFFNSERRLRFYKIYTQSNCAEECLANFTKQECGCVKFSMPRDKNTKICGTAKIKCYKESERKMLVDKSTKRFRDECNCLPACTSIRYSLKIVRTYMDWDSYLKAHSSRNITYVPSVCHILVANKNVDVKIQMETYTFTNFLASCGSLLGLFLGISALSMIELIYYFTLRLFWTIRRERFPQIIMIASDQPDTNSIAFQYIRMIQTFLMDFCKNSNIHGIRYFTERRLHLSERLWWLIAIGLSIWLCCLKIHSFWLEWNENPMIMSNNEKSAEVSTIPFPTVTICPRTKTIKTKFDINAAYNSPNKLNESELARLNALSHICYDVMEKKLRERNFLRNEFTNESIYDTIRDVAPQINDLFYKCKWQGKVIDCSKYFIPILTNHGLCFTFNDLNSHEIYTSEMASGMMIAKDNPNVSHWSLSNGYEDNLSDEKYPFRLDHSGKGSAIDIVLQIHERDFDRRCQGYYLGFFITLTTPGETNSIFRNVFNIGPSEEIQLGIMPKMITTSKGLRNYEPEQRKCFYQTERQLRFYKTYTQQNCEKECLANYTKQECGCIQFSMPRDNKTKICGEKSIKCYRNTKDKITEISSTKTYLDECNCLSSCTLIKYNDANIDRVKINMTAIKNISRLKKDINEGTQQTSVSIYFEEQQIEVKKRMEKYTFISFLAICGGLLGLFMGISALSIIEILYYFTLRLFWIIRRMNRENAIIPLN